MKNYNKCFSDHLAQEFRDKYLEPNEFTFLYYFKNKKIGYLKIMVKIYGVKYVLQWTGLM